MKSLLIFLIICYSSLTGFAHEWKQMFLDYEITEQKFVGSIRFDASYAVPALRDDPTAQQPMRSWLVAKSSTETIALRKEASRYLNTAIHFQNTVRETTKRLSVDFQFPDWKTSPPSYPKSLENRAYFTVGMHVDLPKEGTLELLIPKGIFPTVVFEPQTKTTDSSFYSIEPNSSYTFLTIEKAAEPESAPVITINKVSPFQNIAHSFRRGFGHVIPEGIDHILFIVALCLVFCSVKKLIHQSLLFTLAHSITFAMLASGYLNLHSGQILWVERIIALSIFAIALESLFIRKLTWHRYLLIFIFGLIHGLGYASAFGSHIENKGTAFWYSLISANLGIEIAQILIIFSVFFALKPIRKDHQRKKTTQVIAIGIAITALYFIIERS